MGTNRLISIDLADFLRTDLPERERILPWMRSQSLCMVHAWRGVGKTYFALEIAYAVSTGGAFLNWEVNRPHKVLYVDGELSGRDLQERLRCIERSVMSKPQSGFLKVVTPDLQSAPIPDLNSKSGQEAFDLLFADAELIILDNLSCLMSGSIKENEADSWGTIVPWVLKQRRMGKSILFVHHSGKNGTQRGTSKKEDIMDTVIGLRRPASYQSEDGAVFEIHFEKNRGFAGEEAKPLSARLSVPGDGLRQWKLEPLKNGRSGTIIALSESGMDPDAIAIELGINKSTVYRHLKRTDG